MKIIYLRHVLLIQLIVSLGDVHFKLIYFYCAGQKYRNIQKENEKASVALLLRNNCFSYRWIFTFRFFPIYT